jgi:hypothetical protein
VTSSVEREARFDLIVREYANGAYSAFLSVPDSDRSWSSSGSSSAEAVHNVVDFYESQMQRDAWFFPHEVSA